MGRIAFAALAIFCAIWLLGFAFPGFDRALYGHHGANFSAAQAASLIGKNSDIQNPACDAHDTKRLGLRVHVHLLAGRDAASDGCREERALVWISPRRAAAPSEMIDPNATLMRRRTSRAFGDGPGGRICGGRPQLRQARLGYGRCRAMRIANGIADLGPREMSVWLLSEMPGLEKLYERACCRGLSRWRPQMRTSASSLDFARSRTT